MDRKTHIKRILVLCLFLLSLGGFFLHFRIHSPFIHGYGNLPYTSGIFSIILITALFWFKETTDFAFIINSILVVLGTIGMTHFSIANFKVPLTIHNIFFNTLFADIAILWGKFFLGKAIFDLGLLKTDQDVQPKVSFWKYLRYPNIGWFFAHVTLLSIVYALGHILWK